MNRIVGIYKITSPSGKVYIGQSWNIYLRWQSYRKKYKQNQPKLNNSFAKYGVENHAFEIAHELPSDVEQAILDRYEQLYCDLLKGAGVGLLNLREGKRGGKLSDEAKNKLSRYWTGRNIGRKHNPETVEKIRAAKNRNKHKYLGNRFSVGVKGMEGKRHNADTKAKMAESASLGSWAIYKDGTLLGRFSSSIDAQEKTGIPASTLRRIRTDGRKVRSKNNSGIKIIIE